MAENLKQSKHSVLVKTELLTEIISMLGFQQLKSAFNVVQSKTAHFYLKHLSNALNMLSALRLAYLTC